jgi:hypothetical protein
MSTDLTTTGGNVPALVETPAALGGIDGSSIALPKLYRGEFQGSLVQEGLVPAGSIFIASGPDDPAPAVVVKDGTKEDVLVHILAIKRGLSKQDANGELQSWDFGDPLAPADAKDTYTYFLCLPEVEDGDAVPVKVTMAKTSLRCATRINFHLLKHGANPHELAFRLKLQKREAENPGGGKYRWFVWREELVEAKPENVETAAALAPMAISAAAQRRSTEAVSGVVVDQPAI